jgi:hypothetical protein
VTRRSLLIVTAVLAGGLVAVVASQLPPRALPGVPVPFTPTWPTARGAYHVHSSRSDGTGTLDEIAEAAARAGLQFVIITDHGDGTRAPQAPAYRAGVLCIDGVELSTADGHYVAVGLPQTPYPLRGAARAVIEDVHRLGGFGFVAHPLSAKGELQWRDWDVPFDGLEWLNADSEWRDEFWGSLGAMLLTYPFRPVETLGALLDRPQEALTRWDRVTAERRVVAIAGADAHARLGYRQATDPYEDVVLARWPGYDVSFRAFVNHLILRQPLTGDASGDAETVLEALRDGQLFTSIDSLAALTAFEAKATSGDAAATPGAYLEVTGPVAIEAAIAAPSGTTLALFRNGELLYETVQPALRVDVGRDPGAYRIEARLPDSDSRAMPWVVTNPIYVGLREAHARAAQPAPLPVRERTAVATDAWTAEASEGSVSALAPVTLDDGTPGLEWQFGLAGGVRGSQYAATQFPIRGGLTGRDRLLLRAQSDQPRRISVQLRTPAAAGAERWGTSFYVGPELAPVELRFADFRAVDPGSAAVPPLSRVDSLLLVVDTVNTAPGSRGRLAITDLWFAR